MPKKSRSRYGRIIVFASQFLPSPMLNIDESNGLALRYLDDVGLALAVHAENGFGRQRLACVEVERVRIRYATA